MEVRVVWGLLATMAILAPMSWFSSVDLPALGRPKMETKPDFMAPPAGSGARALELHVTRRWPGRRYGCLRARRIRRIAARGRAIRGPARRRGWIRDLPPGGIRADGRGAPRRSCGRRCSRFGRLPARRNRARARRGFRPG